MAVNEYKYRVVKLRHGWQVRIGSDKHGYHAAGLFNTKADAKAQADSLNAGHGPAFPGTGTGLFRGSQSNPIGIRAQVRRLPSGQVQLKVPLRKGENPMAKAQELARALGRKITLVSVARKR
jgi:hypothetical protein